MKRVEGFAAHRESGVLKVGFGKLECYVQILANLTGWDIGSRSYSPWYNRAKARVGFIRAFKRNICPCRSVRESRRVAVIAYNTRPLITFGAWREFEATLGAPRANPVVSVCGKVTSTGLRIRFDYDIVALPNSDKDRRVHVRVNGNEVGAHDLKKVVVDGEDQGRLERRIDEP